MTRLVAMLGCGLTLSTAGWAELREGVNPPTGQLVTAPIGGDVYEHFRYVAIPTVTTEVPIVRTIILAHVNAPAGANWIPVRSKASLKACYLEPGTPLGSQRFMNGCAIDDDGDGSFDRIAGNPTQGAVKLEPKVPYKKSEYLTQNSGDVREKLIFSGVDSVSIKMSYREFAGDLARPAFTQDVTFPRELSLPQTIRFRDVRLRVEAIDGEGLHYRVLP